MGQPGGSDDVDTLTAPPSRAETIATCLLIHDQVVFASRLHTAWIQLFHGREKGELWNELVPYGMGLVQGAISHAMVMTICRITDPAETGPKHRLNENCTFDRLANMIESQGRGGLAHSIRTKIWAVRMCLEPIRLMRNKHLGHLDHVVNVREPAPSRLGGAELLFVLKALSNAIEEVRIAYGLEPPVPPRQGLDPFGIGGLDEMPDGGLERLVSLLTEVREGRSVSWPKPFRRDDEKAT